MLCNNTKPKKSMHPAPARPSDRVIDPTRCGRHFAPHSPPLQQQLDISQANVGVRHTDEGGVVGSGAGQPCGAVLCCVSFFLSWVRFPVDWVGFFSFLPSFRVWVAGDSWDGFLVHGDGWMASLALGNSTQRGAYK